MFDLNQTNKVKIKSLPKEEELFKALVLGVRDYFEKSYHEEAIIGLSGGIDSALTAVIAKEALWMLQCPLCFYAIKIFK